MPWLPTDPNVDNIGPNAVGTVTGWGRITNEDRFSIQKVDRFRVAALRMNKVDLPIIPKEQFDTDRNCQRTNPDIQLCAGGREGRVVINCKFLQQKPNVVVY